MKILPRYVCVVVLYTFYSFEIAPTSGQVIPIIRAKSDNDDIGTLLTILLLASQKNKGDCGCCNNCCGCGDNKPIPYPIPISPRSPLIRRYGSSFDYDYSYDDIDDWNNDDDTNSEGANVAVPDDVPSSTSQVKNKQGGETKGQTLNVQGKDKTPANNKGKATSGQKVDSNPGKASAIVKTTSGNKGNPAKGQGTSKRSQESTKASS